MIGKDNRTAPRSTVVLLQLDVVDETSIRAAATRDLEVAKILDEWGLDYIINNAAVVSASSVGTALRPTDK